MTDTLKLTSVTGYYTVTEPQNSQYTFAPIAAIIFSANDTAIRQFTQEVRIASDFAGVFNFLTGGFYEHSRKNASTGSTFSTAFVGPERTIQVSDS